MTLFGYDQGVFSGVVVTQDFLKLDNLVGPTKTNVLATVTAIYDIGCFVGAVITFTIGERLGRKKAIIIGTVIMSIGTVIKVTSYSLPQMIVGRVVLGWLIAHGRTQEATEILACIEDKPTTSPIVTAQLHETQYSVDYELQHAVKWKDILLRRNKDTADTKTLRRLLLGAHTQLM
ncbi:hypothetical protein BFJ68_g1888 [Fusarium oxysporum]|uniref:Major facilitator superfamily (MFS) profile domain-containing protein n=1 Tax=Fusarium oxysporum TaxID=5507 RepID=A0A420RWZ6_FUSOX|nr:hypothetical protein BFJ68_g1888 [Fusarium oxysporum]